MRGIPERTAPGIRTNRQLETHGGEEFRGGDEAQVGHAPTLDPTHPGPIHAHRGPNVGLAEATIAPRDAQFALD